MMPATWTDLFLSFVFVSSFTFHADAPAESPEPPNAGVQDSRITDLDGRVRRPGTENGLRPIALVFLDEDCPISNRYLPRLHEIALDASNAGVEFYGVLSDPAVTRAAARSYRDEREIRFPILFDAYGELASRLRPTHVPEAFVIDAEDRVAYRGRIDDRFAAIGRPRAAITSHDLAGAVLAVASGKTPEASSAPPVGCLFEAWKDSPIEGTVTYTRHIAPILKAQCVDCHRKGDIGPFPLETFEQARRRAKMIASVTEDRWMPPWHAAPGHARFRDERRLSDREIALLRAWADSGTPRGEDADLPTRTETERRRDWKLGEPDLVLAMPDPFEVPADGDDIYRYFVLPTGLKKDRAVRGFEFRPGDPTVVHHAIAFVDPTGTARKLDAADPAPGFSMFGNTDALYEIEDLGGVGGWAPGSGPYELPAGLAMQLPAGGDIVLEVHYHLSGTKTSDQSTVAIYYTDEPEVRFVDTVVVGTQDVDIPPGEAAYRRHVFMDVPVDMKIIDIGPHMHFIGREVEVTATLPDGSVRELLRVPRWDFRWQSVYVYREPVEIPAGSRIDAVFTFDNSADNPANPTSPPKRVRWGWGTEDEMCEIYVTVLPSKAKHAERLAWASYASWFRSAEPRR